MLIAAGAFAVSAPIIGLGVRASIDWLLSREEKWHGTLLADLLYNGPTLAPVMWVWAIRGLPLALAVWWPAIARLPGGFGEATRMDTSSRVAFLCHELIPVLGRPFAVAAGLVAVFSLGEVSASRLVTTPGGQSFAHDVFARMHFGITPDLAAMCLVLLAIIAGVALATSKLRADAN